MNRHGSGPPGGDGGQGSSPRKGVDSARRRLDSDGRRSSRSRRSSRRTRTCTRGPRIDGSRGRRCPPPVQASLDESKRRRDVPILWPESLESARQEDNVHELLQLFRYDIEEQYRQPIHRKELETK